MIFLLSINCINLSINANINAPNIIIKSTLYPLHRNEHGGVCIIDLNGLACTHIKFKTARYSAVGTIYCYDKRIKTKDLCCIAALDII